MVIIVVDTLIILVDTISNNSNSSIIIKMSRNLAMPVTKGLLQWSWERPRFATIVVNLAISKEIALKSKMTRLAGDVDVDVMVEMVVEMDVGHLNASIMCRNKYLQWM
jgi:uncharacterized protein YukJ